jgi:hypothetical protein
MHPTQASHIATHEISFNVKNELKRFLPRDCTSAIQRSAKKYSRIQTSSIYLDFTYRKRLQGEDRGTTPQHAQAVSLILLIEGQPAG